MKSLLRFLGWSGRKPGDMWPFPFAGFEPAPKPAPQREPIRNIPTSQLREAAAAWRASGGRASNTMDIIDDLIDEIDRLRGPSPKNIDWRAIDREFHKVSGY